MGTKGLLVFTNAEIDLLDPGLPGQEIAPAYTEQNDPVAQREALQNQAGEEQQKLDEDFLVALEHGMPPAGGIGIGIDRLIMQNEVSPHLFENLRSLSDGSCHTVIACRSTTQNKQSLKSS